MESQTGHLNTRWNPVHGILMVIVYFVANKLAETITIETITANGAIAADATRH